MLRRPRCSSSPLALVSSVPAVARCPADATTAAFLAPGPHAVGVRSLTLVDSTRETPAHAGLPALPSRTLPTQVWYPADGPAGAAPVANAPLAAGGPFPLVASSHGFGELNVGEAYLAIALARRGFVVAAPTFPLTNLTAPGGLDLVDAANQPADVRFVIDQMLALSDGDSWLAGGDRPQAHRRAGPVARRPHHAARLLQPHAPGSPHPGRVRDGAGVLRADAQDARAQAAAPPDRRRPGPHHAHRPERRTHLQARPHAAHADHARASDAHRLLRPRLRRFDRRTTTPRSAVASSRTSPSSRSTISSRPSAPPPPEPTRAAAICRARVPCPPTLRCSRPGSTISRRPPAPRSFRSSSRSHAPHAASSGRFCAAENPEATVVRRGGAAAP